MSCDGIWTLAANNRKSQFCWDNKCFLHRVKSSLTEKSHKGRLQNPTAGRPVVLSGSERLSLVTTKEIGRNGRSTGWVSKLSLTRLPSQENLDSVEKTLLFSTGLLAITTSISLQLGDHPTLFFIMCMTALVTFYMAQWQIYVSGVAVFRK